MPWRCTPPRPEAGGAGGGTAVAVDCRLSGTGISPGKPRASQAAAGHALSTSTPAAMLPGLSNSAPVESHWVPSTSRVPSPRCPPRRLGGTTQPAIHDAERQRQRPKTAPGGSAQSAQAPQRGIRTQCRSRFPRPCAHSSAAAPPARAAAAPSATPRGICLHNEKQAPDAPATGSSTVTTDDSSS